jgi:transcription elongation factor Elf1
VIIDLWIIASLNRSQMNQTETIVVEALFQPETEVYQLIDRSGRVTHVRKDLIVDNKLDLIGGQLLLTAGLYKSWFKLEELARQDEALFRTNIYKFYQHRAYLLAHPELCNKYSNKFGAISYVSSNPCLGALALSFTKGERVVDCPQCGSPSHLYFAVGSVLSGTSNQSFICENEVCQHDHVVRMGGMSKVVDYFNKIQDAHMNLYPTTKEFRSKSFSSILEALLAA